METYFWSFIVALMVFFVGGAVSVWQGLSRILHPEPLDRLWLSYLVLGVSAVFEGSSFLVGYREFRQVVQRRRVGLLRFVRISKDPSLFATLLEDGAALTGLAIAALGVAAAGLFGIAWADGAASVAIGVLLLGVAVFLGNETRSLIAGEAAAPPIVEAARRTAEADPRVERLCALDSLHLGPRSILIGITLQFRSGLSGDEVQAAAHEIGEQVRASDPRIGKVFLRPGTAASLDADPSVSAN
jgi:divalent metal cation (Fe/Co/Zn/Cd) transporter